MALPVFGVYLLIMKDIRYEYAFVKEGVSQSIS